VEWNAGEAHHGPPSSRHPAADFPVGTGHLPVPFVDRRYGIIIVSRKYQGVMSFITSGVAVFSRTYVPSFPAPDAVINFVPSNPQETTVDLSWDPVTYASSYSIESSPATTTQTTSDVLLMFIGLSPDTMYTFTITPSNATGNGPPTTSDPISTL